MVDTIRPSACDAEQAIGLPVSGSTAHGSVGSATNQAATVVLAADASRGLVVGGIWTSYKGSTTPTGRITLADSSGNIVDLDINNDQVQSLNFDPPLLCGKNSALTVTLGAGGSGVTGKVYCHVWKME